MPNPKSIEHVPYLIHSMCCMFISCFISINLSSSIVIINAVVVMVDWRVIWVNLFHRLSWKYRGLKKTKKLHIEVNCKNLLMYYMYYIISKGWFYGFFLCKHHPIQAIKVKKLVSLKISIDPSYIWENKSWFLIGCFTAFKGFSTNEKPRFLFPHSLIYLSTVWESVDKL